ncbi:MAG TPA: hypothetical protein VN764_07850, partial [Polyangiaceae bacterium]|nr:hypothetical protein [Polyangiaceae bacterium]
MSASLPQSFFDPAHIEQLVEVLHHQGPDEAVTVLSAEPDAVIVEALGRANPALADEILWTFGPER